MQQNLEADITQCLAIIISSSIRKGFNRLTLTQKRTKKLSNFMITIQSNRAFYQIKNSKTQQKSQKQPNRDQPFQILYDFVELADICKLNCFGRHGAIAIEDLNTQASAYCYQKLTLITLNPREKLGIAILKSEMKDHLRV